jgi:uroporphyrinogen-III synthase
MTTTVFISRDLSVDSPLRVGLEEQALPFHAESLIEFRAADIGPLPAAEWVFFYSPRAVHFLLQAVPFSDLLDYKIGAIGNGTANALTEHQLIPDFIGSGHPPATAEAFGRRAKGKRVLFPRARHSRRSIQQLLEGQIRDIDWIVYENIPKETIELPDANILLFTSPLNAEIYYQHYGFRDDQITIAIGPTTRKKLADLGAVKILSARAPKEKYLLEACLEAVRSLE